MLTQFHRLCFSPPPPHTAPLFALLGKKKYSGKHSRSQMSTYAQTRFNPLFSSEFSFFFFFRFHTPILHLNLTQHIQIKDLRVLCNPTFFGSPFILYAHTYYQVSFFRSAPFLSPFLPPSCSHSALLSPLLLRSIQRGTLHRPILRRNSDIQHIRVECAGSNDRQTYTSASTK